MEDKFKFLQLLDDFRISEAIEFAGLAKEDKELFLAALGDYFLNVGNLESARQFYLASLSHKPNPSAHFGLGEMFLKLGAVKESIAFFMKSAESKAYMANSYLKIGMAQRLLGNIRSSLSAYLFLKSHGYDKFILDINMAVLLSDLGLHDEAESYYESAISKAPENDKVKFNYALHLMSKGDFKKGLELYESRPWCFRGIGKEWNGEPGRRVLVLAEQGYGDLIQFSRFIPYIKEISESVCLACDPNVASLVSSVPGVDEVVGLNEIDSVSERYPEYCRVMSIPYLMDIDLSAGSHTLSPNASRIDFWKGLMPSDGRLKVGLCWQGGKRDHLEMAFNDKKRSIDLKIMQPILDTPDVHFYSLQKDWKEPHPKIIDLMGHCGDFSDVASFISNLDLVISVDTAIAHVAGSVGTKTWMLSRVGGCWRWGNFGSETFWYPSMRIYRQESMDDWASAIRDIKDNLASLASN